MATHSNTLAWKIPWMEESGRLLSIGLLRVGHDERLHFHFSLSCVGEGNGNPLQCSCLENPRDGGAWWAAVYGVTQNQTRLKRLSSSSSSSKWSKCINYLQNKNKLLQGENVTEASSSIDTSCNLKVSKLPSLTRRTFVGKVMSLLFNMLSWLVKAFLSRSKCF